MWFVKGSDGLARTMDVIILVIIITLALLIFFYYPEIWRKIKKDALPPSWNRAIRNKIRRKDVERDAGASSLSPSDVELTPVPTAARAGV